MSISPSNQIDSLSFHIFTGQEGRPCISGDKNFYVAVPNLDGSGSLRAPFGVDTKSFGTDEPKSSLSVILEGDIVASVEKFQEKIFEAIKKEAGEFYNGVQKNFKWVREYKGDKLLTVRVNDNTAIKIFDIKKGTFSKSKTIEIPSNSMVGLSVRMGNPWKLKINGSETCGVLLYADEIIVVQGAEKKTLSKRKTIQELMVQAGKKRTKIMEHKDL